MKKKLIFMSRFITYGDLPLECHLEFTEDHALKYFKRISIDNEVPDEKRWDKPVSSFLNFFFYCLSNWNFN